MVSSQTETLCQGIQLPRAGTVMNEVLSGPQCRQRAGQGIKLFVEILNASFQIILPLRLRGILM